MNFDNFKYNKALIPEDEEGKTAFFKQLEEVFKEEVKNSPRMKDFFAQYNDHSVNFFSNMYASKRVEIIKSYEYYQKYYKRKEENDLEFHQTADKMLCMILQKKLFNMQLLWRAERLDIKEIDLGYDFQFWEQHIDSCPFITEIEEREINVMKQYLLQRETVENDTDYMFDIGLQNYYTIMEKNDEGDFENVPDWYQFYDARMNTTTLMLLPDIRGKKEDFYFELSRTENRKKSPNPNPTLPKEEDTKPRLGIFTEDMLRFAKEFETDIYIVELFKYYSFYNQINDRIPDSWDLEAALETLSMADRPIHLPSHLEWDKAIMDATKHYINTRIVEALDVVYENYLTFRELGIKRNKTKDDIQKLYEKDDLAKIYRRMFLEGRKLNGESEDFNY